MTNTAKVEQWSFPFKAKGAEGQSSKIITDPQQYYDALAKAESGYYPIGRNGLWHGGVHFDKATAGVLDQSSIHCIADGEVVAYRIDERYPISNYSSGAKIYSKGFVLVRHRLEVPKPPATVGSSPPTEPTAPQPSLTFFSLYMHLLDWEGYGKPGAPTPPTFLCETLYSVKPERATDSTVGLRVRAEPNGSATVKALLPKGTKVRLGEVGGATHKWRRLSGIEEGAAVPALTIDEACWVFPGELQNTSEPDVFLVGERANDAEPTLASDKGLNVRKTGSLSAPKTGLVPAGTKFTLEPGSGSYRKLKEIVEGKDIAPLHPSSTKNIQGFIYFPYLKTSKATPTLNSTHILETPVPVKAGAVIGHVGVYQNRDDGLPSPLVHIEVFSCEDVPGFITKSKAVASSLPAEQKTLLKVHKNASKLITHRPDITAENPPKVSDPGVVVGVDMILSLGILDSLPADRKITVKETIPGTTTPKMTTWWRLDNLFIDTSGNPVGGWLCEQPEITTRHSPWEWEGFDFISETPCNADYLACHLDATGALEPSEQADYAARIDQADNGPVKTRLYDIIDGADGSARDKKLTPDEIRAALEKPWHAQSISRLIAHYENEWFWKAEKWNELDALMSPGGMENQDWLEEKKRIEDLAWWKEVGLLSINGLAWNFQPVALLATLGALDLDDSLKWLEVQNGQLTFDVEGNDIEDASHPLHIYFSRVAHWPGGASGVTIGRGYDLGQRPSPEHDLASAKIAEPLHSWLLGAKGLKGQAARDYLSAASPEIRAMKITRRQQYDLFVPVYELMKNEVIRISGSSSNVNSYGILAWEAADKKIQDIAVDLIYRGDYTPSSREKIQKFFVDNDLEGLREIMSDSSSWSSVPEDRFNRRASYLE